jgi:hypothetical protein
MQEEIDRKVSPQSGRIGNRLNDDNLRDDAIFI